jgi:MFS family permease
MLLAENKTGMDSNFRRPNGMQGLYVIWLGQIVSGVASSITAVALPIWVFNITGSGTAVGLLEFFFFGSYLLTVLFAGVLIDRYNRKMMMLVYDFFSLAAMAILLVLQTTGNLEVWHLYANKSFSGLCLPVALLSAPFRPWCPETVIINSLMGH